MGGVKRLAGGSTSCARGYSAMPITCQSSCITQLGNIGIMLYDADARSHKLHGYSLYNVYPDAKMITLHFYDVKESISHINEECRKPVMSISIMKDTTVNLSLTHGIMFHKGICIRAVINSLPETETSSFGDMVGGTIFHSH